MLKLSALLLTPTLVCVPTTLLLYFANQSELNYQWAVLLPFVLMAAVLFLVGLSLSRIKSRRIRSPLLWFYYLFGLAFLAFSLLREVPSINMDSRESLTIFFLAVVACLVVLVSKVDPDRVTALFGVISIVLLLEAGINIATNIQFDGGTGARPVSGFNQTAASNTLPNIYHLVLDEYQSDFFDVQLSESKDQLLQRSLSGFSFYPNASALYNMTTWSISSVFLGEEYQFPETDVDYQSRAFNGEDSFLASLKKQGYSTLAYTRKLYPFKFDLFDKTIVHTQNSKQLVVDNSAAFIGLWVYRVMPKLFSKALANRELFIDLSTYESLENRTFLANSAPQESLVSYMNYLPREQYLPAHGRYTYIHLLLPHTPYVYDADCAETRKSSMSLQSQCATQLILRLTDELKRLGRYQQSLIIINGDHGSKFRMQDGQMVKSGKQRSHRSLLLIKPAGKGSADLFRRDQSNVSIIHIAAGVKAFLGNQADAASPLPWWWHEEKSQLKQRERHFNIVNSPKGKIRQFLIKSDQQLQYVGELLFNASKADDDLLTNKKVIPIFPVNTIIEAEDGFLSPATEVRDELAGTNGAYVTSGSKYYRFELLENAQVDLSVRAITPNGNSNSTFFRIDDRPAVTWEFPKTKVWKWQRYKSQIALKKGVHTLALDYREPMYIDQLELSTNKVIP